MALTQVAPWNGADGVAATTGNTGFSSLIKTDTTGVQVFRSSWTPRGLNVVEMSGTTSAGYVLGVVTPAATTDTIGWDIPVKPLSLPTSEMYMLTFHQASDARQFGLTVFADGSVCFRDGAVVNAWKSAAGVLAVNVPAIIRLYAVRHASAGQFQVQVVNEDGTVRADSGLVSAKNTGSATLSHVKVAAKSSSSSVVPASLQFGTPRYDTAAAGLLPLWVEETHHPAHFGVGGVAVPVNVHLGVNGVAVQII